MDYYLIFQYFIYFVAKIFAIFIHIQTVLVTNLNRGNHESVNKWTILFKSAKCRAKRHEAEKWGSGFNEIEVP